MAKMTKKEIINGLKMIGAVISADAEVQASVDFTISEFEENERNVTGEDLKEVIKSVENLAKKGFTQLVAEAEEKSGKKTLVKNADTSLKKTTEKKEEAPKKTLKVKKNDKKEEKTEEQPKGAPIKPVDKKEDKKETKKLAPKTEEKKEETKKEEKKTTSAVKTEKEVVVALPQTIESKALNATLVARPDLKDVKAITKAYNEETDFVLACYWTKRHLKQYANSYDPLGINPNVPKSFENDLDLVEVTYADDKVVTGVSLFSSVPSIFLPKDFDIDPDTNLRYANGVEFEVYEVVANE